MAEGFKDFAPGDILTAADVDDYLMQQAIMVFADSTARTTALSSVLREGMMSYLKDTNAVEVYDGSAWVAVGGVGNANFTDTETGSYTSGGTSYKYLTFNASGTITIDQDGLADLLIIAGGGGGGTGDPDRAGGGGGAGGYLAITGAYLPAGTLTVVVGGGGAGATSINTTGSWGTTSKIASYYAPHGAGGSGVGDGFPGGSASGAYASPSAFTGGTAIADLGNDGGDSFTSGTSALRSGGGGGGAGGVGGDGASGVGGAGGSGTSSSITNSATSRAGGGGGGSGTTGGSATDGGGAGGGGGAGSNGTANTGGGGGGAGGSSGNGGNGGSGVVIVRVEV